MVSKQKFAIIGKCRKFFIEHLAIKMPKKNHFGTPKALFGLFTA